VNIQPFIEAFPYLWGGTSTQRGRLCGFTKTIYFLNGIVSTRDASQQIHTGLFDKLFPGDLYFLKTGKTETTKDV